MVARRVYRQIGNEILKKRNLEEKSKREFRKQSEAAIKVQTRIRMIFAKRRLRKKKMERKKEELKLKQEKIKQAKKKEMAKQRLEKKRALLAMKQREKEKKIIAEGGYLPPGWNKEKRGERWCFQAPDGSFVITGSDSPARILVTVISKSAGSSVPFEPAVNFATSPIILF